MKSVNIFKEWDKRELFGNPEMTDTEYTQKMNEYMKAAQERVKRLLQEAEEEKRKG